MKLKRSIVNVVAAALLAAPALAACDTQGIVAQYPGLAPILGARSTASPFVLERGHIQGKVLGTGGEKQPIPLAFVTTGGVSTFSSDPKEELLIDEDDSVKDKDGIVVKHDFNEDGDLADDELCTRIIRKTPGLKDENRFVYLRKGEFFLEGVPVGTVSVTASLGTVVSTPNPIVVYKNTVIQDVTLDLFIPTPLPAGADGAPPRIVEWAKLDPINGITVTLVKTKETDPTGGVDERINVTYKPDPPDCSVTLRSPPGSKGAVIGGYEIIYEYSTTNSRKGASPLVRVGPITVPTPPLIVPAAQPISFGSPVVFTIPVGSTLLTRIFDQKSADDIPGLVVANITFQDNRGQSILGSNEQVEPLKVAVPLRAL